MVFEFDPLDKEFIYQREAFIKSQYRTIPAENDVKLPKDLSPENCSLSVDYSDLRAGFEAGWKSCLELISRTKL